MPITITVPPVGGQVGPGFIVHATSDFIGPLPTGTEFRITLRDPVVDTEVLMQWDIATTTTTLHHTLGIDNNNRFTWNPAFGKINELDNVRLFLELVTPTGVTDSGSIVVPLNSTTGMPYISFLLAQGSGGLTPTEQQQLANTDRRTQVLGEPTDLLLRTASGLVQTTLGKLFSRHTLDLLTLNEVTDGPTCEPVRTELFRWSMGVIVRVTTIADDLVPRTPDSEWYLADLAVLRVFRGQDLQYRRGIHTPTFMTEHPWQYGWMFLDELGFLGAPPDITIAVDWREGCCGQVFLQLFP